MKKLVSTNPAKNYAVLGSVTISTAKEIVQKVIRLAGIKDRGRDASMENTDFRNFVR